MTDAIQSQIRSIPRKANNTSEFKEYFRLDYITVSVHINTTSLYFYWVSCYNDYKIIVFCKIKLIYI